VTAPVVPLRPDVDVPAVAGALAAVSRHLDRCKLAARTVRAYKRQAAAYVTWLAINADAHGDAFADLVGAEGAVTAWKRELLSARASAPTVNQALAAVTLMYEQAGLRISVKRVRIPRPGEPGALTRPQEAALRRAAARRGPRDSAIIAVLLDTGARVEECARLDVEDFAITARTGEVRLHGKGDEVRYAPLSRRARDLVSAWLNVRGRHPVPIWTGQRGPLTVSGITQVVLAAGDEAGIPGLRPHRARHTFATRLRQGGADPAQIQAMLGHASIRHRGQVLQSRASRERGSRRTDLQRLVRSRGGMDDGPIPAPYLGRSRQLHPERAAAARGGRAAVLGTRGKARAQRG
jgi:integrase